MPYKPWPSNHGISFTKRQHSYKHPLRFYSPRGQPCSLLHPSTLTTVAEHALYDDKFKFQTHFPPYPSAMLTPGCWSSIFRTGLQKPGFKTAFGAEQSAWLPRTAGPGGHPNHRSLATALGATTLLQLPASTHTTLCSTGSFWSQPGNISGIN